MSTLAILLATTVVSYACRDLADPQARRWFQDEPCAVGFVHDPLPPVPLLDAPPAAFPPAPNTANNWAATEGSRVYVRWGRHGGHHGHGRRGVRR